MELSGSQRPERPCEVCGLPMVFVSTLTRSGLSPKTTIYRCDDCRRIEIEIEKQ